ncbi:hypothetical protein A3762_10645 [Oleiphilus sp. HI0125]|uniref:arginine N-succinyltransferase n=1 Tax=Oleiphilus sp. HI0125 TaxID=1822266 RepID=UPI0007C2E5A7|nr:arginine N-succinyltransferase [Oleiphilus sp. HI0125]KZZ57033.1 hypothetical protein A3762_10645 [Oleiphilus sp. HI0125]
MHLVRPCTLDDLSSIESLVRDNQARIASLPRKRARLAERIEQSMRSFQSPNSPSDEGKFFLFVLENTQTGELVACSGIAMNNEFKRPFYNYRLGELIHASEEFDIHTPVSVLHLTHELTGRNVLCSLAIRDDLVDTDCFQLIARARLMFMRQFAEYFSDQVVVELQGVYGEKGQSVFWDDLGRNFFNMDFASANYHVATKSRTFLAELMPAHPIYVTMLSERAQAVLGKYDQHAEPVHSLLMNEGFKTSSFVDIFDGGPVLLGRLEKLRTFNQAHQKTTHIGEVTAGSPHLVCNDQFEDFRCGLVPLPGGTHDVVRVSQSDISALNLNGGAEYFFSAL